MKKIKELSLIMSGVVLGLGLSFSPQIYAATSSLLGSKVDKVIVVKLDKVELGKAIAVDGTSYLPIRSLSNALDVGVDYTSSEIKLTSSKGANTMAVTPEISSSDSGEIAKEEQLKMDEHAVKVNSVLKEIIDIEKKIKDADRAISLIDSDYYKEIQGKLKYFQDRLAEFPYVSVDIERYKTDLDKMNKDAADAKINIPIFKANIADLQAQLAALNK